MARARFVGPANPGPDGEELGHEVPMLGRVVHPDELVEMPGVVLARVDGGWVLGPEGAAEDDPGRYLLPATMWAVEDEPPKASRKPASKKTEE
jgi:hypothetical protein